MADDEDENNITAWIRILTEPIKEVHDMFMQLRTGLWKDNAVGAQLDLLGKIVRQPRRGLSDEDYLRYISARIVANKSDGLIEDLILICKLIVDDPAARIYVQNQGDACLMITILGVAVPNELANIIIDMLQLPATAGGVRVILQSSSLDPSQWMRWDVDNWDTKVMMTARSKPR